MTISKTQLHHLANLAGLAIEGELESHLSNDLASIIQFMDALTQVNTNNVTPLNHPSDMATQALRADTPAQGSWQTLMAKQAPDYDQGYYLVPQVIDSESE